MTGIMTINAEIVDASVKHQLKRTLPGLFGFGGESVRWLLIDLLHAPPSLKQRKFFLDEVTPMGVIVMDYTSASSSVGVLIPFSNILCITCEEDTELEKQR